MSLHLRLSAPSSRNETPDRFGLRKVVVAVTEYGKLYGMDSMSGSILWQVRYPGDSLRNSEQQQPATGRPRLASGQAQHEGSRGHRLVSDTIAPSASRC